MKMSAVDVSVPVALMGGQTREKSGEGWSLLPLVTTFRQLLSSCDPHRSISSRRRRAENEV